jgi:hypothetical protein
MKGCEIERLQDNFNVYESILTPKALWWPKMAFAVLDRFL